jgi:hypothetical protein
MFIVGCGRSGTTMLRLMLDAHSAIAIPGESHFIPPLWSDRRRYAAGAGVDARRLAADIMRTPHFQLWDIPKEAVWRRIETLEKHSFGDVVEAVFTAYADEHGKKRWGDKTPIYVVAIPLLAHLFPGAQFVHLIRDGRDVALSYLSVPWGPSTIWEAAHKWRRDVSTGRRDGRALGPERYMEVRYEALVSDPRHILGLICNFAGLPFEDVMLEPHRDGERRLQAPSDGVQWHSSAIRPPTKGLRSWRAQMPAAQSRSFEVIAGDLLTELGYERTTNTVSRGARTSAALRTRALEARTDLSRAKKFVRVRVLGRRPAGIDSHRPV